MSKLENKQFDFTKFKYLKQFTLIDEKFPYIEQDFIDIFTGINFKSNEEIFEYFEFPTG